MKIKFCGLIYILVISFLISACATNSNKENGQNQSPDVPTHIDQPSQQVAPPQQVPPPQPILFDTVSSAVAFVKNPDFSKYYEKWQYVYQSMVELLPVNGQLLTVSHIAADLTNGRVTLFPEAKYEDVGIGFWFEYEGVPYQVIIYNIKTGTEYIVNTETENITDYYEKRFGIREDYPYDYANTNNVQIPQIFIRTIGVDNSKLSADCIIDDTHYIVIRTKAEKTELLSFVNGLQINSVSLVYTESSSD